LYCDRLPDNQECHELRYKRLRKLQKDVTKLSADSQQRFSSSSTEAVKHSDRSCASRVFTEHKETASSTSHGAGIAACNATLLDPSSKQQQQQQRMSRGAGSTLQQRLAELSQSLASSADTQSAAAANTDLAELLTAISAAVNRPAH